MGKMYPYPPPEMRFSHSSGADMGSGKGQSVGKGVGELRTVLGPRSGFDKPTFLQFPSQFERERGMRGKDECGEPLWKAKVKVDNKFFITHE
jgi:hypothetical protein